MNRVLLMRKLSQTTRPDGFFGPAARNQGVSGEGYASTVWPLTYRLFLAACPFPDFASDAPASEPWPRVLRVRIHELHEPLAYAPLVVLTHRRVSRGRATACWTDKRKRSRVLARRLDEG
jgi:hypothetical protein